MLSTGHLLSGRLAPTVCLTRVDCPSPQPCPAFNSQTQLRIIRSAPRWCVLAPCRAEALQGHTWLLPSPVRLLHQILMPEVCARCMFLTKKKLRAPAVARQHPPPVSCPQPRPCPVWFLWPAVGGEPRSAATPPRSSLHPASPTPEQRVLEAGKQLFAPLI